MAINSDVHTIPGLIASGTLATKQYHVVKMCNTTAMAVKAVTGTTDTSIGVLQNAPTSGQAASVAYAGISRIVAGTSIGWRQGIPVGYNTTGRAVPRTTSVVTTWPEPGTIGRYLLGESTVANGDIISIIVQLPVGLGIK